MRDNLEMAMLPRAVDERALYFTPLGLGGPLSPEVAQELAARRCAQLTLPDVLPPNVRGEFAKVLRHFADGVFDYNNYTSAFREAHRVLEVALKTRYLEHYAAGVPLVTAGVEEIAHPKNFDELQQRLRRKTHLHGYRQFNGSLASLLYWARHEGYFYGQCNHIRETMTRKMRNEEQHSEFPYVFMPPDTLRCLHLVSQMIARLWGTDMPSSAIYSGTVERELMVVGKGPAEMEGTQFLLEQLPFVEDDEADERRWYVVSSVWEEELVMWWTPELETTSTPVTLRWGPGSWDELRDAAASVRSRWGSDTVSAVDRTFYVRTVEAAIDHARSAAQVLALRDRHENERWCALLADTPNDARAHVHRMLVGECKPHGCSCPVALIFERARRETAVRHARSPRHGLYRRITPRG